METNYSNYSMLDMVFENRNKAYGAYVLRRDYNKLLGKAMMITVSSILLLCLGNFISEKLKANVKPHEHPVITNLTDVNLKKEEKKPLQMQKHNDPPKPKPTIQNTELGVVAQSQVHTDSVPTAEIMQNIDPGLTTNTTAANDGKGVTDGTGTDKTFEVRKGEPVSTEIARIVEIMPEFPGGEKALMRFLAQNTEYPNRLRDLGIGGKVITEFTVNEDGRVSDIKIIKSPDAAFDREVTRVVKLLPAFKPGIQQGKPVKVKYVLPFTFRTND